MRPGLSVPLLIVNLKNYRRAMGDAALELALQAQEAAERYGVCVALAPPSSLLYYLLKQSRLPILAQHVDPVEGERTTGYLSPDQLSAIGAAGSLLNHSEHRLDEGSIARALGLLRARGLKAVVCASDELEAARLAALRPEFVALEPPELIATGVAVSRARPELVLKGVEAVRKAASGVHVLCGAGIVGGEDVRRALELGAEGVLVASGVVQAESWAAALDKMCRALAGFGGPL